jgi:hypothetical protein
VWSCGRVEVKEFPGGPNWDAHKSGEASSTELHIIRYLLHTWPASTVLAQPTAVACNPQDGSQRPVVRVALSVFGRGSGHRVAG